MLALIPFLRVATVAQGAQLDWTKSQDEMVAMSQLAAGHAWANTCNLKINTDVGAKFLEMKLGRAHPYDASQVAGMMFLVASVIGFQQQMVGPTGCSDWQKHFGARGTMIPGLLECPRHSQPPIGGQRG
jgi:hypothetical protein